MNTLLSIEMKPLYVKSSTYISFNKNNDKGDHKFEIGDHAKESNIEFAKGYTLNWS